MVQSIDSPDNPLIAPVLYAYAINGRVKEMHSNTRLTIYDTINYEQASCKDTLLAKTGSLSSDLSGIDLEVSPA